MIHIERDGFIPDDDWLSRADEATLQLLFAVNPVDINQLIDANQNLWKELKDFLLGISHQKCWYSEAIDTYNHLHVDHFRPKKAAFGIDKIDYGGYWWLAFDWTNYRVCGNAGNVRKKDKFAVRSHKSNDPNTPCETEIIYFLDPTEEEDVLKITFDSSGAVTPITKTGWDFEKAQYTITNLNLNFKNLKEARKSLWAQCSNLLSETQMLMSQNDAAPSPKRSGQIKEKLRQLKVLVNEKSPFSATAKACLRSSGIDWALNYAA